MTNAKLKVVVLTGGPSSEYEVSLKSAKMVAENLNRDKYEVEDMVVSRDGQWPIQPKDIKADIVFIAMHGAYGEDGQVQKILEEADLVYTGSGAEASRLGMDKIKSSYLFEKNGLTVPKFLRLDDNADHYFAIEAINNNLKFPIVVKPFNNGSSAGVSIVNTMEDLLIAYHDARKFSELVMVQEYIDGRELTCGVVDDGLGNTEALMPTEIRPKSGKFFDYDAKYALGASEEITPPDLSEEIINEIQNTAVKAHRLIGCSGMSRTDMILSEDGKLYILELNTIPGMTETSLLPQGAKAVGISFPELLDRIIQAALNRFKKTAP